PPLPGARVVVDPEAPPALGALVVIAYAGDVVRWQGADLPVDDQGVRELAVELDVDDAVLEVVGGGRAQELPVVALSDRVTWLRAEAPEVRRVMFGLDSSELDPLARLALEELASRTGEWSWEVHGSASPEGRVDDNRALAEARAGAVRDALIQLGLPAERVVVGDLDAPDPGLPPEEQRAVRLVPVRRGER
ncbi:MAG TPA: hypothetical protein PKA64_16915, partial [Myxococcota bacterium]|nr:hypothetical protein [Myxococcota bacterium]